MKGDNYTFRLSLSSNELFYDVNFVITKFFIRQQKVACLFRNHPVLDGRSNEE